MIFIILNYIIVSCIIWYRKQLPLHSVYLSFRYFYLKCVHKLKETVDNVYYTNITLLCTMSHKNINLVSSENFKYTSLY